jgi:hypothetical protein
MTAVIFMVAVCIATGPSADRCQPMHNGPTFALLDDCERWIADVAQPDPSVIDMFCIRREVSAWGVVK